MSLEIKKKYLITTKKESILKTPIIVLGKMDYSLAQKEPYDIINLAINEKVVDKQNDDMSYLNSQIYYKCQTTDGNRTTIIVWDDILDVNRTTELSVTFKFDTLITIDDNSKIELREVLNTISKAVTEKYGKNVSLELLLKNQYGSEGESETDADKLEKYKKTIEDAVIALTSYTNLQLKSDEIINKIVELNLSTSLQNITTDTNTIKENVSFIRAQITGK